MNPFRTRKKSKDADVASRRSRRSVDSERPSLISKPPKTFRIPLGKKSQLQPTPEVDYTKALPPSDDFRTSLLMSGLSARFSMLREQDDPNTKIGKASDDSVLFPLSSSALSLDFGFKSPGLQEKAEVVSIKGPIRYKKAEANYMADGYGSDDESPQQRNVMNRPKPGDGNSLFGGRQKIYKLSMSTTSLTDVTTTGARTLYEDDVTKSAFQKVRQREREEQQGRARDREELERQGREREEEPSSQPSRPPSIQLFDYNRNRETSSTTSSGGGPSNTRTSTAATSVTSQRTPSLSGGTYAQGAALVNGVEKSIVAKSPATVAEKSIVTRSPAAGAEKAIVAKSPAASPERAMRAKGPAASPERAIRAKGPAASPEKAVVAKGPVTGAETSIVAKVRRLYEAGLDQQLHEQQHTAINKIDTLTRKRSVRPHTPPREGNSSTGDHPAPREQWDPQQMPGKVHIPTLPAVSPAPIIVRAISPAPIVPAALGAFDFGITPMNKPVEPRPLFGMASPPLSPPMSENEELPVLVVQPNDRGKATALGTFARPSQPYDETKYTQRQLQMRRRPGTPPPRKQAVSLGKQIPPPPGTQTPPMRKHSPTFPFVPGQLQVDRSSVDSTTMVTSEKHPSPQEQAKLPKRRHSPPRAFVPGQTEGAELDAIPAPNLQQSSDQEQGITLPRKESLPVPVVPSDELSSHTNTDSTAMFVHGSPSSNASAPRQFLPNDRILETPRATYIDTPVPDDEAVNPRKIVNLPNTSLSLASLNPKSSAARPDVERPVRKPVPRSQPKPLETSPSRQEQPSALKVSTGPQDLVNQEHSLELLESSTATSGVNDMAIPKFDPQPSTGDLSKPQEVGRPESPVTGLSGMIHQHLRSESNNSSIYGPLPSAGLISDFSAGHVSTQPQNDENKNAYWDIDNWDQEYYAEPSPPKLQNPVNRFIGAGIVPTPLSIRPPPVAMRSPPVSMQPQPASMRSPSRENGSSDVESAWEKVVEDHQPREEWSAQNGSQLEQVREPSWEREVDDVDLRDGRSATQNVSSWEQEREPSWEKDAGSPWETEPEARHAKERFPGMQKGPSWERETKPLHSREGRPENQKITSWGRSRKGRRPDTTKYSSWGRDEESSWESETQAYHNTNESSEIQRERQAFQSELATRRKRGQVNMRSFVGSPERKSTNRYPGPDWSRHTKPMRSNPLGMKTMSSRGPLLENANPDGQSAALKMLGIGDTPPRNPQLPGNQMMEEQVWGQDREQMQPTISGETTPPQTRAFRQARRDAQRDRERQTAMRHHQRAPAEAGDPYWQEPVDSYSRQRDPIKYKAPQGVRLHQRTASRDKRYPPPVMQAQRYRNSQEGSTYGGASRPRTSRSGTSGSGSRPPSRPSRERSSSSNSARRAGRYKDEVSRGMPEEVSTSGQEAYEDLDLPSELPTTKTFGHPGMNFLPLQSPTVPDIMQLGNPNSVTTGPVETPQQPPPQVTPVLPLPTPSQPTEIGLPPRPSPAAPFSVNSTPSLLPQSSPVLTSGGNTPTTQGFQFQGRIPTNRKKSINKADISEPIFISSTSRITTVDLPPGASLQNGIEISAPPIPPVNPRRRQTRAMLEALIGKKEEAADSDEDDAWPGVAASHEERSRFSADEGDRKPKNRQKLRKSSSEGGTLNNRARQASYAMPSPAMPATPALPPTGFPRGTNQQLPVEGGMF